MIINQYGNETFFKNKYCHGKITCVNLVMEISMMYVEPNYRNKGYAKKLMDYILNYIKVLYPNTKRIILFPLPLDKQGLNLEGLIRFYEKFGFKTAKEHPQDKPNMMEIIIRD